MRVPFVLFKEGEIAHLPFVFTLGMHVLLNIGIVHESVNALMIEAAIVSSLMQALLEDISSVSPTALEVSLDLLLDMKTAR